MSFPSGDRSGEASTDQPWARGSVLPRPSVGPHDVHEGPLLKEALDAVRARPEIAEQLAELQEPPDLEQVVEEHHDVIRTNIADQLERTRQLGKRLHELLVAEMASDTPRLAAFTRLSETADVLNDVSDAMFHVLREWPAAEESDAGRVRDVLNAAWSRRTAAEALLATDGARTTGRKSPPSPPEWPDDPRGVRDTLMNELFSITIPLDRIGERMKEDMRSQRPRARERLEFRALETEWQSARADLNSAAESAIQGLVLTALNRAVAEQFSLRMHVRSLSGLRETITNDKVVITSSFGSLESMIGRRAEGSFGIAGPRGVGKSTLIKFFTMAGTESTRPPTGIPDPTQRARLGVAVAAPVAYDPREFVLHLHAEVCRALLGPDADRDLANVPVASPRRAKAVSALYVALTGVASLAGGTTLIARAVPLLSAPDSWWAYLAVVMTGGAVILLTLFLLSVVRVAVPAGGPSPPEWPPSQRASQQPWHLSSAMHRAAGWCASLALCAAIGLPLLAASGGLGRGTWMLLGGLAAVALGVALLLAGKHMAGVSFAFWRFYPLLASADVTAYSTESELRESASDQLWKIRYQQTLSSGQSMTLKLGSSNQFPLAVDVGATRGTTLQERAKTFPEIVAELRPFVESVTKSYQLVIAIDELDKLRSPESVENFLNDIKAVFGASRCFFLVSVSEEAAASFERRGMPFRDVFDSCFDDILSLQRLQLPAAREILYGLLLGWTEPFVALCYILSGGLPRELQRTARVLVGPYEEASDIDLAPTVPDLMRREAVARLWAVRQSLLRDTCDPVGLVLLDRIELIDPRRATASQLCTWYEELRSWCAVQFADTLRTGGSTGLPLALRLGCELAAFMLFAATVIEFFGDTLNSTRLKDAEQPDAGNKSLTRLADARHALALSPWTSVSCLVSFRKAWGI
ncbi:P-loop NTPase fold protein [Streptomyces sp. NPDC001502]|uniref:P-loop NTPase fold protein n=1 Tax=Streptomyces sp. NPDC001502 TaxID=3364578 RepID=UPI00369FBAB9